MIAWCVHTLLIVKYALACPYKAPSDDEVRFTGVDYEEQNFMRSADGSDHENADDGWNWIRIEVEYEDDLDRPTSGYVNICPSMFNRIEPNEVDMWSSTIRHELMHVFAFSISLFKYFGARRRAVVNE
ncbi:unnamed protein product [Nippostrongylus brasiliensis]|uniref:Leishmanolysin-like peptidase n=1 Tax=Nippostrongylus brasiliensis TaxID=27835 RepID=A0A0N4YFZ9_NIPBR|nr:unnamed protein product [Nippostrongylus brasiliensis]